MGELGYDVSLAERIKVILGDDYRLTEDDHLTYEWDGGYEKVIVTHGNGGGMEYAGSYHPNVHCEGGGICIHCGRTLEV